MLKGISPLIPPELLKVLAEMGHGDELVIGDGNYPSVTMGKRCIRCDGQKVTPLLDAILALFPLDTFVEAPVAMMQTGANYQGEPPIWNEYRAVIEKHAPGTKIEFIDRFDFYERSKTQAFATVQTGEDALYACIILKKGVIGK